MAYDF